MAGLQDPFNPGPDASPFAGIDPETFKRVRSEWEGFVGNPQGRAALLSAGLALMQPPSFGDTGAGQIGRAIGAAGQSATANQNMDLKESEAESKQDLRGAQATAQEARAATAEARAGTAGAQLDVKRQQIEATNERNKFNNRVRLSIAHNNYVKDVAKRNSDPLNMSRAGFTPEPVLPMDAWIQANPMLRNIGLVDSSTQNPDDEPLVPATADTTSKPPTTTRSAQDTQALEWAKANPNDPRAAAIKKRLGVQ